MVSTSPKESSLNHANELEESVAEVDKDLILFESIMLQLTL
jgi:hypothetical protein